MKFRSLARAALAGTAALAFSAMSAGAQTFNYFTTGQFTGGGSTCDFTAAATTQTCGGVASSSNPGALGLTFTGTPALAGGATYASGSTIQLGTFTPVGSGNVTLASPSVMFRLFINQVSPTTGQASVVGSFTGTFNQGTGTNFSNLFWTPTQQTVVIGPTTYSLIFDQAASNPQPGACPQVSNTGICIAAVNATTITAKAFTTSTVPEPSSMALLGTGLIGLVPMIRRKK